MTTSAARLTGKWGIISDSSYKGVGINNHLVVYNGQAGDYFDFRADGTLYIKEGSLLDTLSYQLISAKEIAITIFGATINSSSPVSHITTLNAHFATIASDKLVTPGGIIENTIKLKR